MNANAEKWVEALRSGRFQQGQYRLVRVEDGETRYCCLGVACKLYAEATEQLVEELDGGVFRVPNADENRYRYYAGLPDNVRTWLGLTSPCGMFDWHDVSVQLKAEELSEEKLNNDALTDLNDECVWSFEQIADFIENEPAGLFK